MFTAITISSTGYSEARLPASRGGTRRRIPRPQGRRPGQCAGHLRRARGHGVAGGARRVQARAVPRRIGAVHGDHHGERRARSGAAARRRPDRRGVLRRAQPPAARRPRDRPATGRSTCIRPSCVVLVQDRNAASNMNCFCFCIDLLLAGCVGDLHQRRRRSFQCHPRIRHHGRHLEEHDERWHVLSREKNQRGTYLSKCMIDRCFNPMLMRMHCR